MKILPVCIILALLQTGSCQCPQNCIECTPEANCTMCSLGYYGQTCQNTCSVGCINQQCATLDGSCPCKQGFTTYNCRQCVDGKYGENCDKDCPNTCSTCASVASCENCKVGWFGEACESPCSIGCSEACDKAFGTCSFCTNGYSGDKCCVPTSNCYRCSSTTECDQCSSGFYGVQCQTRCPDNCLGSCLKDAGACSSCKTGFYNSHCQSSCPLNCDGSCEKNSGDCIICKDGYVGPKCKDFCLPNCVRCEEPESCLSCKDGFYGSKCQSLCPSNCDGACEKDSGNCYTCKDGYVGLKCEDFCLQNCVRCVNHLSCQSCKDGFYGVSCSGACPTNCNTCSSRTLCHSCKNGFFGTICSNECPENCIACSSFSSCSQCKGSGFIGSTCSCIIGQCSKFPCSEWDNMVYASGDQCCQCPITCRDNMCSDANTCLNGCVDGFHGTGCQKRCKDLDKWCLTCADNKCTECLSGYFPSGGVCTKCSPKCANTICSTTNGTCLEGCANGLWGRDCNLQCTEICKTCDRYDGRCNVCENHRYKRDCSKECSTACLKSDTYGTCNIDSGSCIAGCSNNTIYGDTCQFDCNVTCVGQVCDWRTGKCKKGCNMGYNGEWCERKCSEHCNDNPGGIYCRISDGACYRGCKNGYYGLDCQSTCASICINETCERITGYCTYGCSEGFKGVACGEDAMEQSDQGITGVVLGAVLCVLVFPLLVATVVTMVVYVRRRCRKRRAPSENSLKTDDPNKVVAMTEIDLGNDTDSRSGVVDPGRGAGVVDREVIPVLEETDTNVGVTNGRLDVAGNDTVSNASSYVDVDVAQSEESEYETLDRVSSIRTYDRLATDNMNNNTDNTSYYNVS